jgi:hypothetical protein
MNFLLTSDRGKTKGGCAGIARKKTVLGASKRRASPDPALEEMKNLVRDW